MLCDNNICSVHADKIKPSPHLEGFLLLARIYHLLINYLSPIKVVDLIEH